MSLSEINLVQITEEGDSFIYEVNTKEVCLGKIALVLSTLRSTSSASVIEGKSEWNNSSGTITVQKEKLKEVKDLYVYLKDQNSQITGTPVKVYYEPLSLKGWYITKNLELAFMPDRGKSAFEFSKRLVIFYQDEGGFDQYCMLDLPNVRVSLEQLDLWEDSSDFTFRLGYYMEDEEAGIYSAYCPPVSAYIKPPQIQKTAVSGSKVTLSGSFEDKVPLWVQIYSGGQLLKEAAAEKGELDLSGLYVDEEEGLSLTPYYKTELGRSLYGGKAEVILRSPVMESCSIGGGKAAIRLERSGTYAVSYTLSDEIRPPEGHAFRDALGYTLSDEVHASCDSCSLEAGGACPEMYGKENQVITGRQFQLPQAAAEFQIGYLSGNAAGPMVNYAVKERAVYAFVQGEESFYLACDRPDGCGLNADIAVEPGVKLAEGCAYTGTYFQLADAGEKAVLTMKKEIFTAETEAVHGDYIKLMKQIAAHRDIFLAVRSAVLEKLPMRAGEMLFYYYDHCPESGYVGIYEGMNLMTEYTVYQNIPDARQSNGDLNGFVGTGTAGYQVVERDGRLKIEPFAGEMNFAVAPPRDMGSDNKLCGGAGIADLLYQGFSAAYMRLVYPAQFTDRSSTGNLCYDRNICLLSSGSWDRLSEATEHMRTGGLGVEGCAYHYFRGRAVVVPQICVNVCGNVLRVSLGTRLADVQKSMGLKECRLYRMVNGEKLPVKYQNTQIPLVAGDCLEL